MELWFTMEKLWNYTENYGTLIYKEKNGTLQKIMKLWKKTYGTLLKQGSFWTTLAIERWFTMEKLWF